MEPGQVPLTSVFHPRPFLTNLGAAASLQWVLEGAWGWGRVSLQVSQCAFLYSVM